MTGWWSILIGCLTLSLFYSLAYARYGYCDTMQGYIQGLAWRIHNGEVPYRDFVYLRPPLSLYIHSFTLHLSGSVLISRIVFYFLIGCVTYWSVRRLQLFFDFQPIGISPLVFAGIGYVGSVHNFSSMPWHSTDALFFSVAGFFLLTYKQYWLSWAAGLFLIFVSSLCTFSFLPLLPAAILLLTMLYDRPQVWRASMLCLLLIALTIAMFYLFLPDLIKPALGYILSTFSWKIFVDQGIVSYGLPLGAIVILVSIGKWILLGSGDNRDLANIPPVLFWILFWFLLVLHLYRGWTLRIFVPPSYGLSQSLLLLSIGMAIKGLWIDKKGHSVLLFLLIIAWCVGLDRNYPNPMLYFTPSAFGMMYFLAYEWDFRVPRFFYGITFLLLLWVFGVLHQYPSCSAPRDHAKYAAGAIFKPLNGLIIGDQMYGKCRDLDSLNKLQRGAFTVMPGFPAAHFLTKTQNPLSVDWENDSEIGKTGFLEQLEKELREKRPLIYMERDQVKNWGDSTLTGSRLSTFVLENWKVLGETRFFTIYSPDSSTTQ